MKFFVGDEEREFFSKNGFFTSEEVFSPQEMDDMRLAAEAARFTGTTKDLALLGGKTQDILFSHKLSQLAFVFGGGVPLRYGYDLFSLPMTLVTSIDPLVIGVCIALDSMEKKGEETVVPFTLSEENLPQTKGAVLFFSPKVKLFSEQAVKKDSHFIVLLYAGIRAQYVYKEEDPYTHDLKRLGYVFGDRLRAPTHPVLYT